MRRSESIFCALVGLLVLEGIALAAPPDDPSAPPPVSPSASPSASSSASASPPSDAIAPAASAAASTPPSPPVTAVPSSPTQLSLRPPDDPTTSSSPPRSLRVKWRADWPRFHPVEYGVTAALIGGVVALNFVGGVKDPIWTARNDFDEAIRDGIRGRSAGTRRTAQDLSDAFYYAGLGYPIVDTVGMWGVRKSGDVAAQQFLITLEAMAFTGFWSFISNATIARERAYVRTCSDANPPTFPSCESDGKADGFYSGHTAMAMTSAAATCSHHIHVPLYGNVGDVIACASALGGATATGVLRLVADKHYATDVLTGMAVGFAAGILIPEVHYRFGKAPPGASIGLGKRFMPMPLPMPGGGGLGVVGVLE